MTGTHTRVPVIKFPAAASICYFISYDFKLPQYINNRAFLLRTAEKDAIPLGDLVIILPLYHAVFPLI